jgi:hypothetical protein
VLLGDSGRQDLGLTALKRQPDRLLGDGALRVIEPSQRTQKLHDLPEDDIVERLRLLRRIGKYRQDAVLVIVLSVLWCLPQCSLDRLRVQTAAVVQPQPLQEAEARRQIVTENQLDGQLAA